jgi:hypothetical protein
VGDALMDFRHQVALAARAVAFLDDTFTWFGRPAPRPRLVAPPDLQRQWLHATLMHTLYERFYLQGTPVPKAATLDGARAWDRGLPERLAAHNASRGGWEAGWRVVERTEAAVTLSRHGLRVRAPATAVDPPDGDVVRLRRPAGTVALLPGFYVAHGDAPERPHPIETRCYFNQPPADAAALVATLTRELNHANVPFTLKVQVDPAHFGRPDTAVLYLDPETFAEARPAIAAAVDACAGRLRRLAAPLTKPLADGLTVSEHRTADGGSFGTHRCDLIADGLITAHERGVRDLGDRVDAVARRFTAAGLTLDRPYLGPGTHDRYHL